MLAIYLFITFNSPRKSCVSHTMGKGGPFRSIGPPGMIICDQTMRGLRSYMIIRRGRSDQLRPLRSYASNSSRSSDTKDRSDHRLLCISCMIACYSTIPPSADVGGLGRDRISIHGQPYIEGAEGVGHVVPSIEWLTMHDFTNDGRVLVTCPMNVAGDETSLERLAAQILVATCGSRTGVILKLSTFPPPSVPLFKLLG